MRLSDSWSVCVPDGLRQLFCEMSMKAAPGEEKAIVERMMLADTKLWKCKSSTPGSFASPRTAV